MKRMSDARFFAPARYPDDPSEPITHFVREPAPEDSALAGGDIAWPNGERWSHLTDVYGIDYVNGAPVWAYDLLPEERAA